MEARKISHPRSAKPSSLFSTTLYPEVLSGDEIRLLAIHPSRRSNAPLKCDLLVFDLDYLPPFESLSYNWGDPGKKSIVNINGTSIIVTENLFRALGKIRLRKKKRLLWADALCINQNDPQEKNNQIPLMREIYSSATSVIIWLRDNDEDPDEDPELVAYIVQSVCEETKRAGRISEDELQRSQQSLIEKLNSPKVELALKQFFGNPYFRRIWCVQEVQLAQNVMVYYQQKKIPWDDIKIVIELILDRDTYGHGVQRFGHINYGYARSMAIQHSYRTILFSASRFSEFKASDPRDKIYGLLGLVEPASEAESLPVDYQKSVADVYTDTMLASFHVLPDVNFTFILRERDKDYNGSDGFKSWVPRLDLDNVDRVASPWEYGYLFPHLTEWSQPHKMGLEVIGRDVMVRGVQVDAICFVTTIMIVAFELQDQANTMDNAIVTAVQELWDRIPPSNETDNVSQVIVGTACTLLRGTAFDFEVPITRESREFLAGHFLELMHHDFISEDRRASFMANMDKGHRTPDAAALKRYLTLANTWSDNHRLFWTSTGLYGMGPACLRENDIIAAFYGAGTPVALRPQPSGGYLLLGAVYIDSLMTGKHEDKMTSGEFEEKEFLLV